ncbi:MAG: hypothetical protein A3F82_01670 [Deltaproteobacteria bacterium RIFCSPLOWO2_12_FULL_44_12]|nr:MAG: hypothetical protein A2712_03290 [Deltaproteobacteria bacterium RIFCSPHIGHO2_01_FULL_43_49]OGQ16218.1 MAG: hypothetical protein A3D22_01260 [Deltaproteobacteria bacterium RIFCSPHIGHO2_02_FULL_44_53]OGQ29178.1 MAG: hypothetical protein A3D98_05045 [Deltaproteobacteria bacterium RIFCSPHIGHO2_12_FULL_44_21]OGQ32735.1 MAG: hypothetical protein A2979_09190 [Deltaproteobacteria bacterium RIFCSPLOWO2_01_FULL_45_74]OGQ41837.1 MAG: hypothetical protein A3I70_08975 [Deltaproteobacteria bacterium 
MIQRINFIQKEGLQITYGTLLWGLGGVVFTCLAIQGIVLLAHYRTKSQFKLFNEEIKKLKAEREQLLSRDEVVQGSGPSFVLRKILEEEPEWSTLLASVARALPPNVWLVSFKTAAKQDARSKRGIIVNGTAKTPAALASFLNALEENPYFEKVVLTSSKEEIGVFNFSASCDITPKRKS